MTDAKPVTVTPALREQINKLHPEIKERLNVRIQRKAGHVGRDVEVRKEGPNALRGR